MTSWCYLKIQEREQYSKQVKTLFITKNSFECKGMNGSMLCRQKSR